MNIWILLQIALNVFFLAGIIVTLIRAYRNPPDDPRLNHGLRLLQSKISILEDLSDHTENQVKQLMTLLDKKLQEVRGSINTINHSMIQMDQSIEKSRQMAAKIETEIPHSQIVEKQLESKYVRAAQMAHQGASVDAIVEKLQLPKAEVELISKVNKKRCVYEAKSEESIQNRMFAQSLEMPQLNSSSIDQTQLNFKQAVQDQKDQTGFRSIKLG